MIVADDARIEQRRDRLGVPRGVPAELSVALVAHDDGPDALHMLWMAAQSGLAAANVQAFDLPEPSFAQF